MSSPEEVSSKTNDIHLLFDAWMKDLEQSARNLLLQKWKRNSSINYCQLPAPLELQNPWILL